MKLRYDWSMYPDIINTFIRIYTNTRKNLELKHMDITYASWNTMQQGRLDI